MRNPFESITRVKRIASPMLCIHSPEDTVIPIEEGRRLFEAANAPKDFVEVQGGHVEAADLDAQRMFGAVQRFLEQHHVLPNEGS
jgi:fermentation-respiration switch protein FrsA (DUF1100 family)